MTATKCLMIAAAFAAGFVVLKPASSQEELDPLKVAADTHTVLHENAFAARLSAVASHISKACFRLL